MQTLSPIHGIVMLYSSLIYCSNVHFHLDFIVSEVIYNQTDTLYQGLMYLR